ncbi:hypothetical protein [Bacillus smithii]|uniref:hypothetical protein n=1 Tax=Bacillus smithii TaxID=1479 RepID=UPI003D217AB6
MWIFETKWIAVLHLCNKANFFNMKIEELDDYNEIIKYFGITNDDYYLSDNGLYYPKNKEVLNR